ncbi:tyrosine-protein phosphatase [Candidatus Frankia nodulisporulans]|uniref:tyrosine-protein phosphatase n=3 Tax=Candidatus Frankia nodulisporulans TaxID=2060052 RepID=UPI001FD2CC77|nr:tyrosine-protein phosphatase [Candidatus Frankia nodulisporulans]
MIPNNVSGDTVEAAAADPGAAPVVSGDPARVLELPGAINLRDVGGYRTVDGRTVRWRMLLRCGAMHRLGEPAHTAFAEIGLRTVVDLRELSEFQHEPDMLGPVPVTIAHIPVYAAVLPSAAARTEAEPAGSAGFAGSGAATEHRVDTAGEAVAAGAVSALRALIDDGTPLTLEKLYTFAVDERGERLTAAVLALAAPDALPAVVHCSAGKDRTGMVIALTLALLGVPDETIAADYALTARYLVGEIAEALSTAPNGKPVPAELLICPPELIVATLERIRDRHGDVRSFLLAHGATPTALDELRDTLLTAAPTPTG